MFCLFVFFFANNKKTGIVFSNPVSAELWAELLARSKSMYEVMNTLLDKCLAKNFSHRGGGPKFDTWIAFGMNAALNTSRTWLLARTEFSCIFSVFVYFGLTLRRPFTPLGTGRVFCCVLAKQVRQTEQCMNDFLVSKSRKTPSNFEKSVACKHHLSCGFFQILHHYWEKQHLGHQQLFSPNKWKYNDRNVHAFWHFPNHFCHVSVDEEIKQQLKI